MKIINSEQHNEKLSLKLRGTESLLEIRDNQIKEMKELIKILFELTKSKVLIPSELYKRIEELNK